MTRVGPVDEAVQLEADPDQRAGEGEVVVDMAAANINLTDFRQVEGTYTDRVRVEPPAPLGGEGVGRVVEAGANVPPSLLGQRVILVPNYRQGSWAHRVVAPMRSVYPIGEDIDPFQAAMLASNPATAYLLLHRYVDLAPGDWVVQDMANSAAAQYVIALAHHAGLRTINVVRRADVADHLAALGADAVIVDGDDLGERIDRVLGRERARLVLDGVGGALAGTLAQFLEPNGHLVSYSSMTRTPVAVPSSFLVYRELTIHGFWVVNWLRDAPRDEIEAVYTELGELAARGVIRATVQETFPLSDYRVAFAAARGPKRAGKVLFDLT